MMFIISLALLRFLRAFCLSLSGLLEANPGVVKSQRVVLVDTHGCCG